MEKIIHNHIRIITEKKYIAAFFHGKNKVLSTSVLNGGIQHDLQMVFNLDGKRDETGEIWLYEDDYERHLRYICREIIGVDDRKATGFMTAANMKNAAAVTNSFGKLQVTAVVTGGIEKNGGRVGDPACWHEEAGKWFNAEGSALTEKAHRLGTINILLFIDAALTDGALSRALVTCTEAKTAAIQELSIASCYSSDLATGSGTDGTIIAANMESPIHLTEAGKHCKLGELIGRTVKEAVKNALYYQTGVDAVMQHNVFRRLGRYGLTRERMLDELSQLEMDAVIHPGMQRKDEPSISGIKLEEAMETIDRWAASPAPVSWAALEAHLLDEQAWGLLNKEEVKQAEKQLWKCFFNNEHEDMRNTEQKNKDAQIESAIKKILAISIKQGHD